MASGAVPSLERDQVAPWHGRGAGCPACGDVAVVEVGRASWARGGELAVGLSCKCGAEWVAVYRLAEVRRVAVQVSLFEG